MGELISLSELAHVHLLLNHIPTIGTTVALGLLLLSFVRNNDDLRRVSLEVFFLVALFTLPAYMSGVAAQAALEKEESVSKTAIIAHQNAALWAFLLMQATGLVAWIGLWQFRRLTRPASWAVGATLLLAVLTLTVVTRAANLGGEIRHPEIIATGAPEASTEGVMTVASVAYLVTTYPWVWPASEALHFIGMSLIIGVLLVVNLRLLGITRAVSYAAVHRLLPWAMLGFIVNFVTGMLFFTGAPEQYTANVSFHWKMMLLMIAGCNFLYLTVFNRAYAMRADDGVFPMGRLVAVSSLVSWVGVMYFGRMLPFIGNAF
jgi:uncharacterized membrane protein